MRKQRRAVSSLHLASVTITVAATPAGGAVYDVASLVAPAAGDAAGKKG